MQMARRVVLGVHLVAIDVLVVDIHEYVLNDYGQSNLVTMDITVYELCCEC